MKSVKNFATLIGLIVFGIAGIRLLNNGAIQRTKAGTTFKHEAAIEAVADTVKPFEQNINDMVKPRRETR